MKSTVIAVWLFLGVLLHAEMPTRGLCAHQGDNAAFPNNTVPAFESAIKKGAAMVEFDVKRCKTGELVVMHDPTVDRTTNGTGKIEDLTFEEIRALDAGIKRGPQFAGTKVPTFDEAIDCFPKDGIWINVHCYGNVALEVAKKIREKGRLHQAFLATSLGTVKQLREAVPEIKICNMNRTGGRKKNWTPEQHHKYAAQTVEYKCQFLQLLFPLPPEDVKLLKDAGVKIALFSCNRPDNLKGLLDSGCEFILTDRLDVMVAKWNELEPKKAEGK